MRYLGLAGRGEYLTYTVLTYPTARNGSDTRESSRLDGIVQSGKVVDALTHEDGARVTPEP